MAIITYILDRPGCRARMDYNTDLNTWSVAESLRTRYGGTAGGWCTFDIVSIETVRDWFKVLKIRSVHAKRNSAFSRCVWHIKDAGKYASKIVSATKIVAREDVAKTDMSYTVSTKVINGERVYMVHRVYSKTNRFVYELGVDRFELLVVWASSNPQWALRKAYKYMQRAIRHDIKVNNKYNLDYKEEYHQLYRG